MLQEIRERCVELGLIEYRTITLPCHNLCKKHCKLKHSRKELIFDQTIYYEHDIVTAVVTVEITIEMTAKIFFSMIALMFIINDYFKYDKE